MSAIDRLDAALRSLDADQPASPPLLDGDRVVTTIPEPEPRPQGPPAGSGSTPGFFYEGHKPAASAKNSADGKTDFYPIGGVVLADDMNEPMGENRTVSRSEIEAAWRAGAEAWDEDCGVAEEIIAKCPHVGGALRVAWIRGMKGGNLEGCLPAGRMSEREPVGAELAQRHLAKVWVSGHGAFCAGKSRKENPYLGAPNEYGLELAEWAQGWEAAEGDNRPSRLHEKDEPGMQLIWQGVPMEFPFWMVAPENMGKEARAAAMCDGPRWYQDGGVAFREGRPLSHNPNIQHGGLGASMWEAQWNAECEKLRDRPWGEVRDALGLDTVPADVSALLGAVDRARCVLAAQRIIISESTSMARIIHALCSEVERRTSRVEQIPWSPGEDAVEKATWEQIKKTRAMFSFLDGDSKAQANSAFQSGRLILPKPSVFSLFTPSPEAPKLLPCGCPLPMHDWTDERIRRCSQEQAAHIVAMAGEAYEANGRQVANAGGPREPPYLQDVQNEAWLKGYDAAKDKPVLAMIETPAIVAGHSFVGVGSDERCSDTACGRYWDEIKDCDETHIDKPGFAHNGNLSAHELTQIRAKKAAHDRKWSMAF